MTEKIFSWNFDSEMFEIELIATIQFRLIINVYDEERQVTKQTSPLQSCRSRAGFDILAWVPELSLAGAKK